MDDVSGKVSSVLSDCAETHHHVFRIVEGNDDDWASWYSEWLVTLSELPELLGGKPVRSHLTTLLVELDREYTARPRSERWEDFFAVALARELARTAS